MCFCVLLSCYYFDTHLNPILGFIQGISVLCKCWTVKSMFNQVQLFVDPHKQTGYISVWGFLSSLLTFLRLPHSTPTFLGLPIFSDPLILFIPLTPVSSLFSLNMLVPSPGFHLRPYSFLYLPMTLFSLLSHLYFLCLITFWFYLRTLPTPYLMSCISVLELHFVS